MLFLFGLVILAAIGFTMWSVANAAGRDRMLQRTPPQPRRPHRRAPHPPAAPDDDPEFLRSLGEQVRKRDNDDPPAAP